MIPLSDPDVQRRTLPYVTVGLIALNTLVFLYELTLGDTETTQFFYKWGLVPAKLTKGVEEFGQMCSGDILQTPAGLYCRGVIVDLEAPNPAWITMFSSMFIHGGFMHFIGNMVFLWVFGDNVEDRLGHPMYLVLYLVSGVAAIWTHVGFDMAGQAPGIGASGAIAGVLGAYLLLYPYSRINTLVIFYFLTVIRLPALYLLGFWFLLQFLQGVGSLGQAGGSSVAYWAHVGGFAAGAVMMALYLKLTRQPVWPRYRNIRWR